MYVCVCLCVCVNACVSEVRFSITEGGGGGGGHICAADGAPAVVCFEAEVSGGVNAQPGAAPVSP